MAAPTGLDRPVTASLRRETLATGKRLAIGAAALEAILLLVFIASLFDDDAVGGLPQTRLVFPGIMAGMGALFAACYLFITGPVARAG